MQEAWRDELRTARDFVLAARSAVRISDKRAAIAACDAACDAACAILDSISQQQSPPLPAAEARVPEDEPQLPQQAAPASAAVLLLAAPAAGGGESSGMNMAAQRWERPDPATRAQLIKSSCTSASDAEEHDHAAQLAFALSSGRKALALRPSTRPLHRRTRRRARGRTRGARARDSNHGHEQHGGRAGQEQDR